MPDESLQRCCSKLVFSCPKHASTHTNCRTEQERIANYYKRLNPPDALLLTKQLGGGAGADGQQEQQQPQVEAAAAQQQQAEFAT